MSIIPYVAPIHEGTSFNCPLCGAYSAQMWSYLFLKTGNQGFQNIKNYTCCTCSHCLGVTVWHNKNLVYPNVSGIPLPNIDLPIDIQNDYREAGSIVRLSPRGSAAILRLCIQKLCIHLGESGENINNDIKKLVERGLPSQIQQALDIVRVVGNHAVHPGELDLTDDTETASKLFPLINMIAQIMITQPKEISQMYTTTLPEAQRQSIERRDM